MPVNISGSGSITGLSVGGLENGIITPSELSTGGPSWDATGNVQVSAINGGPLAGMRNAIINGNFDIWQRGSSANGLGYWADRFNVYQAAGSTNTQFRYSLTDAQRAIIGEDTRYALAIVTGDTASALRALQPIEGVRTFAGQTVTVSFWAFTAAGTCNISTFLTQYFGAGGSPSSTVTTGFTLSSSSVSTTPTKITGTVALPSIGGKTLGTDGNDYLGLQIEKKTGHTGTLYITGVQLEAGPVATPFERRPIGVELALCQRYYYAGAFDDETHHDLGAALVSYFVYYTFPVTMRKPPIIASGGGASANVSGSVSYKNIRSDSFLAYWAYSSGVGNVVRAISQEFRADAEL